jgi:hypothetical protein
MDRFTNLSQDDLVRGGLPNPVTHALLAHGV